MSNVTNVKAKMFKAVSASTTSIAAGQTLSGAGDLNLTGTAVNDGSNMASTVTLTSSGNISGVNFTITGTDSTGTTVSEVKAGPNAGTVTTTQAFLTVTKVETNGAVSTNTSVGFSATSTTQGIVFEGRTKVRGLHGVSDSGTAGALAIRNTSQSGTKLLEIDAPAAAGMVDPYIPDNGVLFDDGAFIDISTGYDSVTIFFDG